MAAADPSGRPPVLTAVYSPRTMHQLPRLGFPGVTSGPGLSGSSEGHTLLPMRMLVAIAITWEPRVGGCRGNQSLSKHLP